MLIIFNMTYGLLTQVQGLQSIPYKHNVLTGCIFTVLVYQPDTAYLEIIVTGKYSEEDGQLWHILPQ